MRASIALEIACLSLGLAGVSAAQTTRIHVLLEGANAAGAEVYVDGQIRGRTDASGNLDVDRALLTDGTSRISARLQVYEVPAFLPGHEDARSPGGWVMRAYVTSVVIDDAGAVNMFQVADRATTQELVLRRDNALIGLQVLASADRDLSEPDLSRLMQAFQGASRYLWNATDGQFVFETVKIADQARNWDRSEFRFYTDNTTRPRTTRGGYLAQNDVGRLVGSYMSIPWRDASIHLQVEVPTYGGANPATFVHEFGHLGFELDDEYSDVGGVNCTVRRDTDATGPFKASGPMSACVMDSQFDSAKFCSDQSPNSHNLAGLQYDDCWSEIRGAYSDPQGARWILKTPVTRGTIVGALAGASGTAQDALPVEWNTTFVVTNTGWPTEICKPFLQHVTFSDGSPAPWGTVKLLYTSIDPDRRTWISQGKTYPSGDIAILGAHVSDTVMTQVVFDELTTCPQGVWPQGALGVLAGDQDGDRVLDAFDSCPSVFNPYALDPIMWYGQSTGCSCTTSAQCGPDLVCSTAGGPGACVVPTCRTDADCSSGRTCQGASCVVAGAACTSHAQCSAGLLCDAGNGTSHTGLCVPAPGTGAPGDLCSHDNHCRSGNCSGLQPDQAGGWRPGRCSAVAQKGLGEYCFSHPQCASGYCDAGDGTSKTQLCMPNRNGVTGDICSRDDQCASLNCGGLAPAAGGGWQPGHCSASATKPLGDSCFGHGQCASGYCDGGLGTSNTWRCLPNRDGLPGQICSHDNQCASLNCSGLSSTAAAGLGTCAARRGLGVACLAHNQCASGYCDGGPGTSSTWRCMPLGNGRIGDICSHDNQCTSAVCAGLRKDGTGAWVPGACAAKKALRDQCSQHYQCASGYCDAGWNTSQTELCMPNGDGRSNDPCSQHNQCTSRVCAGVQWNGTGWNPGTCQ
jgi:hypothetical protein